MAVKIQMYCAAEKKLLSDVTNGIGYCAMNQFEAKKCSQSFSKFSHFSTFCKVLEMLRLVWTHSGLVKHVAEPLGIAWA